MGVARIIRLMKQQLKVKQNDEQYLARIQEKRLRKLLRCAVKRSPFYQDLYRGIDPNTCRLTDLPVVTKPQMMENFDDFVTDRRLKRTEVAKWLEDKSNLGKMYLNKFIPFQTSGTTGVNALVVYDRKALDYVHACVMSRHAHEEDPTEWEQLKILVNAVFVHKLRMATVVMTGGPYPAYTGALYAPSFHSVFVDHKIFSLLDPIDKLVEQLNEFQPDTMISYPSLLEMLAREQLAGRLNIRFDHDLSQITTGSEPLSSTTRRLVKQAWNKDIQDTYGSSECFVMARSCYRFDRMHVMNDLCIMEIVDRNNNPVPDGQTGEKVLVTNLCNFVQPFIRYEITDVTGFSIKRCDCGQPFPTLLPVEGRTDDIFYIDRPGGGYEAVHPYLFLGPIVELDSVREYQLAQTGRNEVTFYYVAANGAPLVEEKIRNVLEQGLSMASLAGRIDLKLVSVDRIPRDQRSGKFRQIVSLVDAPEDLDDPEVGIGEEPAAKEPEDAKRLNSLGAAARKPSQ